ncbi:MAG TPA: hypothetical protein P5114_13415, partial [Hyphomicrobiaceae bacterium]|nr:hypothetical protein [Hyphomicrobiaceae bacterium]
RLEDRSAEAGVVGISANLRQILEAAAAAARGRRSAIDGAIVLAAIVGDGRSTAAHLLRAHGLTFEEAIKALQQAAEAAEAEAATNITDPEPVETNPETTSAPLGEPSNFEPEVGAVAPVSEVDRQPAEQAPTASGRHRPGASADEILATARQRVEGRFAQGLPEADAAMHTQAAPSATAAQGVSPQQASQETPPVEEETELAASAPHHGRPDLPTNPDLPTPAPLAHEAVETGPRPAPPAKRPLPPGAIRPAESVAAPDQSSAEPVLEPQSRIDEGAIDEVLASIRKIGRTPADQPFAANLPPPAPQRPAGRPSPQPPPPAHSPGAPTLPPGAPAAKPSDRDFWEARAPGQAPLRSNATTAPRGAPPMPPPPPGRNARPARAPLPGLPPTPGPGAHSGAAYPPAAPKSAPRRTDAAAGGRPRQAPPTHAPPTPSVRPGGPPVGAPPLAPAEAMARQRSPELSLGEMVENIPRLMRVGLPVLVETRIARSEVKALAEGLQGGGAVWRHDMTVTKAMSVRLRAPEGGFFIETSSPETQWIENTLGLITDDYASWRWTVTPKRRGTKQLQLIISARTIGTDGLVAETALPDQIVSVKVRINYAQSARKIGGWAVAAIVGGVLAQFGEGLPAALMRVIGTIVK